MTDKVLDKIRKLLAMARDAGASENEQAQAMRLASALMMKHGIDEATANKKPGSVGYGEEMEADRRWKEFVSVAAGKMYGCRAVRFGGGKVRVAGREENSQAASVTYEWLLEQIEALYKAGLAAYKVSLGRKLVKADYREFRRTFKDAAALRVQARINKQVEAMAQEDALALEYTGSKALAVQAHRKTLDDEVDSFFEEQKIKKSTAVRKFSNGAGTRMGAAAGDKVKLNRELGA